MTQFILVAILVLLFLSFNINASGNVENVCSKQCKNESSSFLQEYCLDNGFILDGHCCKNKTMPDVIIGIDLRGCDLVNVKHSIQNLTSTLVIISLEDNPLSALNDSDFYGLTDMLYLSLPPTFQCPGGPDAWLNINSTNTSTICVDQVNMCSFYNVSCPSNSHCQDTAPGLYECHCDKDYHGYKCLRTGTFPILKFSAGLAASTLVVCIIMWILQRRHVKKTA